MNLAETVNAAVQQTLAALKAQLSPSPVLEDAEELVSQATPLVPLLDQLSVRSMFDPNIDLQPVDDATSVRRAHDMSAAFQSLKIEGLLSESTSLLNRCLQHDTVRQNHEAMAAEFALGFRHTVSDLVARRTVRLTEFDRDANIDGLQQTSYTSSEGQFNHAASKAEVPASSGYRGSHYSMVALRDASRLRNEASPKLRQAIEAQYFGEACHLARQYVAAHRELGPLNYIQRARQARELYNQDFPAAYARLRHVAETLTFLHPSIAKSVGALPTSGDTGRTLLTSCLLWSNKVLDALRALADVEQESSLSISISTIAKSRDFSKTVNFAITAAMLAGRNMSRLRGVAAAAVGKFPVEVYWQVRLVPPPIHSQDGRSFVHQSLLHLGSVEAPASGRGASPEFHEGAYNVPPVGDWSLEVLGASDGQTTDRLDDIIVHLRFVAVVQKGS